MENKKVCFITGATGEIGQFIVAEGVNRGYKVVAFGRNEDKLQALKKEHGDSIDVISLDLGSKANIEEALNTIFIRMHEIDCVINSTGKFAWDYKYPGETVDEQRLSAIEDLEEQNYLAPMRFVDALKKCYQSQNKVKILNVSSHAASFPLKDLIIWPEWGYVFSKRSFSKVTISRGLDKDEKFKYLLIEPKIIDTPKMRADFNDTSETRRPQIKVDWDKDAQKPENLASEMFDMLGN
ncbi:SDR family NAD(P)-dependent oxidoreductase [Candidatus Nomurabacteria bacterium]|nr:MAG: SDR family NAD(P)-dependent oxidoreductase [Candidatus Nomurabacteria bacterium]